MRIGATTLALALAAALAPALTWAGETEDKQFAQGIATELRDSGLMKDYSVGVKAKDGTIWLNGRVATGDQLQTCLQIVSEIQGVENIVNNLSVAGSGAQTAGLTDNNQVRRAQPASANTPTPAPMAAQQVPRQQRAITQGGQPGRPLPMRGPVQPASMTQAEGCPPGGPGSCGPGNGPMPMHAGAAGGNAPAAYDQPSMPGYAWPSYAAYPNYAATTYPKQYSASAWPYIGPFYPYPQVPMGWRKVSLEWDDGWWFLDFDDRGTH